VSIIEGNWKNQKAIQAVPVVWQASEESVGNNTDFLKRFEPYVKPYKHKVFIADGAKWIWNWAEDFYGNSVQTPDFFHAIEKCGSCLTLVIKDIAERRGGGLTSKNSD